MNKDEIKKVEVVPNEVAQEQPKKICFIRYQTLEGSFFKSIERKEIDALLKDNTLLNKWGKFNEKNHYKVEISEVEEKSHIISSEEVYVAKTNCKGVFEAQSIRKVVETRSKKISETIIRFQKSWACEQKRNTYIVDDACC